MQAAVSQWLMRAKGICVNEEWLGACLEWLQNEERGGVTESTLQELVYEQWLHADLRDVAAQPCVPASVAQQKTQISGRFVVQVDSIMDVGASAYSQLQKLKGQSIDASDTPDEKRKSNWEPRPTQLLFLSLTDGTSEFQAMEYRPIPQLSVQVSPGAKIQLQGSIDCRLGVLLLCPNHVQVLGGRVDHLVEKNKQKKMLSRKLNDESLAGEDGNEARNQPESNPQAASTSRGQQPPPLQPDPHRQSSMAEDVMIMDVVPAGNQQQRQQQSGHASRGERSNTSDSWTKVSRMSRDQRSSSSVIVVDDSDLECNYTAVGEVERRFGGSTGQHQPPGCGDGEGIMEVGDMDFDDFADFDDCDQEQSDMHIQQGFEQPDFGLETVDDAPNYYHCEPDALQSDTDLSSAFSECKTLRTLQRTTPFSDSAQTFGIRNQWQEGSSLKSLNLKQKTARYRHADDAGLRSDSLKVKKPLIAPVKPLLHHTRAHEDARTELASWEYKPPLVTLSDISSGKVWDAHPLVKVKAHFIRVVERLSHHDGVWMVTVLVGDSQGGRLHVHLSNEILERLIGFTATEFREHIEPHKSNPAVRAKGSKGFKHCQSALADLNCFMEIRRSSSHKHPFVEKLLDT